MDQFFCRLHGLTQDHLAPIGPENSPFLMHKDVIEDFLQLQKKASEAGFDLRWASSFRSFERQCLIWNEKAMGLRPLLGAKGEILKREELSDEEMLWAILRWSAIPGLSRHHWGCDVDVYDHRALMALPEEQRKVELTQEEVFEGGVFFPLHQWLDDFLPSSIFFRPYTRPQNQNKLYSGVAPEMWHLSHRKVAKEFEQTLNFAVFYEWIMALQNPIQGTTVELAQCLLKYHEVIYRESFSLTEKKSD